MQRIESFYNVHIAYQGYLLDADTLIYLSDESGLSQVYRKNIQSGEVRQLTFLENRVLKLEDAHVGRKVFFSSDEGGNEQVQIYLLDVDDGTCTNITRNPAARFSMGGVLPDGRAIVASSNARSAANYDLVKIDLETFESTILLQNNDNYNIPAALSPDGRYLLYNKMNGISENYLWMLDIHTGEAVRIHPEGSFAQYQSPCWKHDGSGFYLATDFDANFVYAAYYDLAAQRLTRVYESDWDVDALALSADDRYLALCVNEDGYSRVKLLDVALGEMVNTPLPPNGIAHSYFGFTFSGTGRRLTFALLSVKRPGNIWMLDLEEDSLRCLTPTKWTDITADDLVEPELCRFTSFDGLSVPYWLYRKAGTQAGAPVVFEIHGGPEGQEWPNYSPLTAYLVSEGFVVAAPNVRGSTGYGKAYHHLDDVEKRLDSIHDVAALAEHLIGLKVAQKGRMAIMGASYGGFMTLSGITEYPDLFAAAVDEVGMSNLETFLENTAEYRRAHRESEYGSLAKDRDTLRRVSPIHKADDIITPLMVVHGANDPRVPVGEAEQIVASLKKRGIDVTFLCYPDEGHGLSKLKNKLDCYPQVAAFFKKYLVDLV